MAGIAFAMHEADGVVFDEFKKIHKTVTGFFNKNSGKDRIVDIFSTIGFNIQASLQGPVKVRKYAIGWRDPKDPTIIGETKKYMRNKTFPLEDFEISATKYDKKKTITEFTLSNKILGKEWYITGADCQKLHGGIMGRQDNPGLYVDEDKPQQGHKQEQQTTTQPLPKELPSAPKPTIEAPQRLS